MADLGMAISKEANELPPLELRFLRYTFRRVGLELELLKPAPLLRRQQELLQRAEAAGHGLEGVAGVGGQRRDRRAGRLHLKIRQHKSRQQKP